MKTVKRVRFFLSLKVDFFYRAEERRKENIMELEAVKSLRKTQTTDFELDIKEDPRETRKRELANLMKIRATGQEFSVESTPKAASTTTKHVTIKARMLESKLDATMPYC